ncbi:poly-beta-1,6 N-acetyl-D-glucosamine export porin PgaA [Salinisphaera sp. SPP-AMP-43]|uniref:poly-beta-1,6 N-acetyl-D-glucosamine export porin PgaA n=1 Tax=Salinisphaera sp. SPP-AMP-43 TaxID=3121288 RepID=UPI003C6DD086
MKAQDLDPARLPLAGQPASAYGPAVRPGRHHPNANDIAGLAERQRQEGHPSAALQLATRVRAYAPDNLQAMQTEISSLAALGAFDKAYQLALRPEAQIDGATLRRLRVDRTAAHIRHALDARRRMEDHFHYARRNDALVSALQEIEGNFAAFPKQSTAYRRTQFDRIYVLNKLGRMQAVIEGYQQLKDEGVDIPSYIEQAAADAYVAVHEPGKASQIYEKLLAAEEYPEVELSIAQYYALVDAEHYDQAAKLLAKIDRNTPYVQNRSRPGSQRAPNWERMSVDQLKVMDANYRNHAAEALRRIQELRDRAPGNVDLINTQATTVRWRGEPEKAQQITKLAAAYAPRSKDTRLNLASNAHDLGHYDRWRNYVNALAIEFPNDTAVHKSLAEVQDRKRPSFSVETQAGRSDGGSQVTGSHDVETQARLNSPWTDNGWRAYAGYFYSYASFEEGSARFSRPSLGAEWAWDRKHAWGEIGDDRFSGDEIGVALGWSQWVTDHWQYQLSADTYSHETPLRAERAGYQGRLYQGAVTWRQNESRSASFNMGALDISDGNLRSMVSAQFTQRIQANAHHLTQATIAGFAEHNDQPGGAYFNPKNSQSAGVTLQHDWITWRAYNRSFTQTFQVDAASDWQSGYGAAAGVNVQYEHNWDVSRTWSVHYGVGWSSHVYDGDREQRLYGMFGLSGSF